MKPHAVIVMGPARSGTSSVAQGLSRLGVWFDDRDQMAEANDGNADGYWEHKELSAVVGGFQASLNQESQLLEVFPEDWRELPRSPHFLSSFRDVFSRRFSGHRLVGFKNPVCSTVVPFVAEALDPLVEGVTWVLCARHPEAVARSQHAKYGLTTESGRGIWLWNMLEALDQLRGRSAKVVAFPEVVSSAREQLEPVTRLVPGWEPSPDQWRGVQDSYRPDLVRMQGDLPELANPTLKATWELARQCADQPERFQEGLFNDQVAGLHRAMRDWQDMLRVSSLPKDEVRVWTPRGAQRPSVAVPYSPTRRWQTVELDLDVHKGVAMPVHLYALPVLVWVRRAEWEMEGNREPAVLEGARCGTAQKLGDMTYLSVVPGAEQATLRSPSSGGRAHLTLELMVEPSLQYQVEAFSRTVAALAAAQQPGRGRF